MSYFSIPRSGLVGEWLLDGNANDTNDGTKNNGTATNVSYTSCPIGYVKQCASVSSGNGKVTMATDSSSSWTISLAVYVTSFSAQSYGKIYDQSQNDGGFAKFSIQTGPSGSPSFLYTMNNGSSDQSITASGQTNATWNHILVTYDGTSKVATMWQNNVYVNTFTLSGTVQAGAYRSCFAVNNGGNPLNAGLLSSVRHYNRVLNETERLALWHDFNRRLGGGSDFGAYVPAPDLKFEMDSGLESASQTAVTNNSASLAQSDWLGLPKAMTCNGSSGSISFTEPNSYSAFTLGFRFRVNDLSIARVPVCANNQNYMFQIGTNGAGNFATQTSAYNNLASTAGDFVTNTWYTVFCTYDGSTKKIYKNGTQIATVGSISGSIPSGSTAYIGVYFDNTNNRHNGQIGDVFIWKSALNADQVKYAGACLESGRYPYSFRRSILNNLRTKANWWLGHGDRDISGNANHGTPTSVTAIRNGQCLGGSYNGSSSYIETGTAQALDACTFAATIQVSSTGSAQVIMGQRATGTSQRNLVMKVRSGGVVGFFMRNSGVGIDGGELIGSIVMQAGKKYRVVVTRNGATYRAYVNGAFDTQITNGSSSTTASATFTTASDWDRGTAYERLTGQIFDPVVYGSALTDEEVRKDYYATFNGI